VVAQAAVQAADRMRARAIVAFTQSGATAQLVSKYRPSTPIIAFTPREVIQRRMGMFWGVFPRIMRAIVSTDRLVEEVEKSLLAEKMARRGDNLVILMGAPIYRKGTTNLLKVHRIV
jgi:pyruvate kinase